MTGMGKGKKQGRTETMKSTDKHRNHRSRWALAELRYVEQHYGKVPISVIAEKLRRTPVAVKLMARSLGCRIPPSSKRWTEAEVDILRRHYGGGEGIKRVSELLPGRNPKSIQAQAFKLGINSPRTWSKEEFAILKRDYPTQGTRIAAKMPGRSRESIRIMAASMGIRYQENKRPVVRQQRWTDEEKKRLREYLHLIPTELVHYFPGRSKISVAKARERMLNQRSGKPVPRLKSG